MEYDLTKQSDVVSLMQSSKSESEWNTNCDKVISANGGKYPLFWFAAIIASGIINMSFSQQVG